MTRVSHAIDRIEVSFDDPNLVANAGLMLTGTLSSRLALESLIDSTVKLAGRGVGARPRRKVLTLTHAMIARGTHIDHAAFLTDINGDAVDIDRFHRHHAVSSSQSAT